MVWFVSCTMLVLLLHALRALLRLFQLMFSALLLGAPSSCPGREIVECCVALLACDSYVAAAEDLPMLKIPNVTSGIGLCLRCLVAGRQLSMVRVGSDTLELDKSSAG